MNRKHRHAHTITHTLFKKKNPKLVNQIQWMEAHRFSETLKSNMNINMLQAQSELKFLSVALVLSLKKNQVPSYTQGACKPGWEELINIVTLRWRPKWHPREASECLWHLVHPAIFHVPCEDCIQRGYHQDGDNAGLLTITSMICPEVCSPEVPTQSTANLPGHLQIVPRNISNIHQPPKRCDYITKPRRIPRVLLGEGLINYTQEPNIQDQCYMERVSWVL